VIPGMIRENRVFCYEFTDYWRDVGTLHSYWEANLEALDPGSGLDLRSWDVRTNNAPWLAVSHRPLRTSGKGRIRNSLVSKGCLIEGTVENSVLSPGVCVREGATVSNSVILNGCIIGQGSVVNETIIDKHAIVGRDVRIGEGELSPNKCHPSLLDSGLTLIGREARLPDNLRVGRNCLIRSRAKESDFPSNDLLSGLCV
jgi:glucose-1-phosphate adenylyltransferase